MLFTFPVEKLSKQTTLYPWFNKYSQRLEPMKPAPPVTKTDCILLFFKTIYNILSINQNPDKYLIYN